MHVKFARFRVKAIFKRGSHISPCWILFGPAGPLSRSNWNLEMLVFQEGGKPGKLKEKPSEQGDNQQHIG